MTRKIEEVVAERAARRRSSAQIVRDPSNHRKNIWLFDSPKRDERLVIEGDLPFMQAVLLELDSSVAGYFFFDSATAISQEKGEGVETAIAGLHVYFNDGRKEVWLITDDDGISSSDPVEKTDESGERIVHVGAGEILSKKIRLDNALHLCAYVNRIRDCDTWAAYRALSQKMAGGEPFTLADCLKDTALDQACVFGVVARQILSGALVADLDLKLLSRMSVLEAAPSTPPVDERVLAASLASARHDRANKHESLIFGLERKSTARGRPRSLVPAEWRDYLTWPDVDDVVLQTMSDLDRKAFNDRRNAVILFIHNIDYEVIYDRTTLSEHSVRYWVQRCVLKDGEGGIFGFRALLKGFRIGYTRVADIKHQKGEGRGGAAGALGKVLREYPELDELIEKLLFNETADWLPEKRMPYHEIWLVFKRELASKGPRSDEWPSGFESEGEEAIRVYCKRLEALYPERCARGRASNSDSLRTDGSGFEPHIQARRVCSFMQLDFHKVDGLGSIVLVDEKKVRHVIPVARFYVGLMADEKTHAIHGFHALLQTAPSAKSVLEVIESAIRPQETDPGHPFFAFLPDGKFLISFLVPELNRSGFTVLRMDRAWCNTSADATNNIMDVVGCAINFGPSRAWWARAMIERLFRALTNHSVQRLPSTLGKGHSDERRDDPVKQAERYEILVSDLIATFVSEIRQHNVAPHEGLNNASPVEVLRAAIDSPEVPYLPQPLVHFQDDWMLFAHREEMKVGGSYSENIAPFLRVGAIRARYSFKGGRAQADLMGRSAIVYIDLRDIRKAVAVVPLLNESFELLIERRFRDARISWSEACLLGRERRIRRGKNDHISATTELRLRRLSALGERVGTVAGRRGAKELGLQVAQDELLSGPECVEKSSNPGNSCDVDECEVTNLGTFFGIDIKQLKGKSD